MAKAVPVLKVAVLKPTGAQSRLLLPSPHQETDKRYRAPSYYKGHNRGLLNHPIQEVDGGTMHRTTTRGTAKASTFASTREWTRGTAPWRPYCSIQEVDNGTAYSATIRGMAKTPTSRLLVKGCHRPVQETNTWYRVPCHRKGHGPRCCEVVAREGARYNKEGGGSRTYLCHHRLVDG